MKKYLKPAMFLILILSSRTFADLNNMFSVDLSRLYYEDEIGRIIDYDFSAGTIDPQGTITIPDLAIIQRASGEADTTFLWERKRNTVNELYAGFCKMSIPQAEITTPSIPYADIVIDGSSSDWDTVPIYVPDQNTEEDDVSIAGSDIEYVKLAYSTDGSKLNILIKVTDAISQGIWYRVFFDHDVDEQIDKPGNYQVDFAYNTASGWDVVSQGWNSEDGYDWYPIDEQGEVSVTGDFIEGSVNVSAIGIGKEFFLLGRSMMSDAPYIQYDNFEIVKTTQEGFSSLGSFGSSSSSPSLSSPTWQTEMTFDGFQNASRNQYPYSIQAGAGTSGSEYQKRYTQSHTPLIDGEPDEWATLESTVIVAENIYTGSPDADIQRVYTAIDANYVYFMVETADRLKDSSVTAVEINFDYKHGKHFNGNGSYSDIHLNVNPQSEILSAYTGDFEPLVLTANVKTEDVLEVAIPRSELGDEGYFNPTFVNTWKSDSIPGQGEDPSWADPVVSPRVGITWFTGVHEGNYYENVLVLYAEIDSDDIDSVGAESDDIFLFGYNPATTIIDLRIEVQNGTDLTVLYRINSGSWTNLWQHTIPAGQMLSFPHLFPYVHLETGYDPIPGDSDYDGMVNGGDFAVLSSAWMSQAGNSSFNMRCDMSDPRDGVIDIIDFLVFAQNWLAGTTP